MTFTRHTFLTILATAACTLTSLAPAAERPNILWLTCEDISANLGCYGDRYARTPNLDEFATEGVLYTSMYATAPICSPARSCIITGVQACSLGTQHLRSKLNRPPEIRCYTEYLRQAGYYCTNNVKTDYQFTTTHEAAWDECSTKAHWRNRPAGMPFFSIFNQTLTHQSKTRYVGQQLEAVNSKLPENLRHDPAKAPLPPYYADTQVIRENVAAYYNQISIMDQWVGTMLAELENAGLADNTIVFFYSDHGGGIPRAKRWLHHNGIRVPFMIRCPEKYQHLIPGQVGSRTDQLVSFADLAPTMLSLTGLPIPEYMQGRPFLGPKAASTRDFVFASRDRVDEVVLCNRTVVDGKYQYIRNFLPHRPRMPLSWYSEKTPIRAELRRLHKAGKLKGDPAWLLQDTVPAEELYDLAADPHQMKNLADSTEHAEVLNRLRGTLYGRMREIRDTGVLPEAEMRKNPTESPYAKLHAFDAARYDAVLNMAKLVGMGTQHRDALITGLSNSDEAVRYWAAVGLAVLGRDAEPAEADLQKARADPSPSVQIAAAEALCNLGLHKDAMPILLKHLERGAEGEALDAAAVLFRFAAEARPMRERIAAARKGKSRYVNSAIGHILDAME